MCVAITVPNGSDGEWGGRLTGHILAPAVLTVLTHATQLSTGVSVLSLSQNSLGQWASKKRKWLS